MSVNHSIDHLLQVPPPYECESLTGYIQRVALCNDYYNANWIYSLSDVKKNLKTKFEIEKDLCKLANLLRMDPIILRKLTFIDDFSNQVGLYLYGITTHSKYCPECFMQQNYHFKLWDLSFYPICDKHQLLLIDCCPNCHRAISSRLQNMNKCLCGFLLENLPRIKVKEELSYITRLIEDTFLRKSNSCNNILTTLTPSDFSSLILFIIRKLYYDKYRKFPRLSSDYNNGIEYLEIINAAFNLFQDWPNNFYDFLDQFGSIKRRKDRKTGVSTYFGRFYIELYAQFSNPCYNFIRFEFERYLKKNFYRVYFNRITNFDTNISEKSYISGLEASKILKVNHDAIADLIIEQKFKGEIETVGKQKFISVDYKSLLRYKEWKKSHINLPEAVLMLGINRYQIIKLFEGGHLEGYKEIKANSKHNYFNLKSIQNLVQQFENQLCLNSEINGLIDFNSCIHSWGTRNRSICELVEHIISGNFRPIMRGAGTGLNEYLFSKKELVNLADNLSLREIKVEYSLKEVCILLGTENRIVKHWIDEGYLKANKVNRKIVKINYKDLELFKKEYITLLEISRKLNQNSKKLVNQIKEMGVTIVFYLDGRGGYLFLREEIEKILF
ncbi:TniQ family protein [Neobacillus citreus]|uniref:TniQ family protein n=1 Tax=Neobacillus citreus TaxID=2833578 RepID=A0A942T0Z4_9BACI|nr:TniQ family protein [Neobacillus citreus]MCH6266574.1 TniQ family protein [Neobacillus citreus]